MSGTGATGAFAYENWTDEETLILIQSRIAHQKYFVGQKGCVKKGWEMVAKDIAEKGVVRANLKKIQRKWSEQVAKYKELKKPPTGVSTEDGEDTALTWELFDVLDSFFEKKHTINPPAMYDSSMNDSLKTKSNFATGNAHYLGAENKNAEVLKETEEVLSSDEDIDGDVSNCEGEVSFETSMRIVMSPSKSSGRASKLVQAALPSVVVQAGKCSEVFSKKKDKAADQNKAEQATEKLKGGKGRKVSECKAGGSEDQDNWLKEYLIESKRQRHEEHNQLLDVLKLFAPKQ